MDWTPIRTLCVFTIAIALVYLLCYFLFFRFARAELKKINVEWEENALLLYVEADALEYYLRIALAASGTEYSFAELEALARASVTDARVDVDDQRFLSPRSMTDEINSAVGRVLSVGEMAYCIFASLAEGYAKSLDDLREITGESFSTLNIIGGGSRNGLLNELTAAATGVEIITGPTEGTSIGNLMLQMIGSGELSSVSEGRELVRNSFDIKNLT